MLSKEMPCVPSKHLDDDPFALHLHDTAAALRAVFQPDGDGFLEAGIFHAVQGDQRSVDFLHTYIFDNHITVTPSFSAGNSYRVSAARASSISVIILFEPFQFIVGNLIFYLNELVKQAEGHDFGQRHGGGDQ